MKINQWTLGLATVGAISLASAVQAEEAAQHQVLTALSATTLSGYVDTSAIWKFGTDRGGSVLPGRSYDGPSKQDGFNLNVVKLTLEKPLEEGNWSAGYRADLLFGPDANTYGTQSTLAQGAGDFAIKQAYVNLRVPVGNGLEFKMGVWDTIIGYEVFDAASNPNYSRSYGFALEPTTHTGLLASYRINDMLSVSGGIANTGGPTINGRSNVESVKSYMASVTVTAPESAGFLKGSAFYAGVVDSGATGPNQSDVINIYAGATMNTPVTGLSVGAAYDYRGNSANSADFVRATYANAVSLYTSYQATEKLKFNVRGEYASASAGTFGSKNPVGPNNEEFLGVTVTTDYSLWANVISRLEFRWDADVSGGPKAFGGAGAGGGTTPGDLSVLGEETGGGGGGFGITRGAGANFNRNAISVALNIIYKF